MTFDAEVILPLASKVTTPTCVEEPTVPGVIIDAKVASADTFSWPLKLTAQLISPVASMFLEFVKESAVATLAFPKSILTFDAEVILPLASTVNWLTWVEEP